MESVLEILSRYPAMATFGLLLFCGLGMPPWSEEIVILASGYFVAQGDLLYSQALFWCVAGILAGDSVIYLLGAWAGERVYNWPILRRHLRAGTRHKFNRLFFRHGTAAVFMARFIPGFRMMAYFVAGNLGMRFLKFLLLDLIGVALTVPISVYAGWKLADNFDRAKELIHEFQIPLIAFALIFLVVFVRRRGQQRRRRLQDLKEQRRQRDQPADTGASGGDREPPRAG